MKFTEWLNENKDTQISEDINEGKQIVDKKQLEWFINLANKAKTLDSLIDDLTLMKGLIKN